MASDLTWEYTITTHALEGMARPGIPETSVRELLAAPEQRLSLRPAGTYFSRDSSMVKDDIFFVRSSTSTVGPLR